MEKEIKDKERRGKVRQGHRANARLSSKLAAARGKGGGWTPLGVRRTEKRAKGKQTRVAMSHCTRQTKTPNDFLPPSFSSVGQALFSLTHTKRTLALAFGLADRLILQSSLLSCLPWSFLPREEARGNPIPLRPPPVNLARRRPAAEAPSSHLDQVICSRRPVSFWDFDPNLQCAKRGVLCNRWSQQVADYLSTEPFLFCFVLFCFWGVVFICLFVCSNGRFLGWWSAAPRFELFWGVFLFLLPIFRICSGVTLPAIGCCRLGPGFLVGICSLLKSWVCLFRLYYLYIAISPSLAAFSSHLAGIHVLILHPRPESRLNFNSASFW